MAVPGSSIARRVTNDMHPSPLLSVHPGQQASNVNAITKYALVTMDTVRGQQELRTTTQFACERVQKARQVRQVRQVGDTVRTDSISVEIYVS